MLALLAPILNSLFGAAFSSAVQAYQAKLTSENSAQQIAATLAARELAVEQREAEVAAQVIIAEEGRWWTALPRAIVQYSFSIYVFTVVVVNKVLHIGSTDALSGDIATWAGWVMMVWFGGRSAEKVARILKR